MVLREYPVNRGIAAKSFKLTEEKILKKRSVYCTAGMVSAGNGIVFISGTHVKYIKFNEDPILFSIDNDIPKVKLSVVY